MGYHLTIVRTAGGKSIPISLEEAKTAALSLGNWEYSEPPATLVFHSANGSCTLWHEHGELWAKTPEEWALEPILSLARELNARVRGDEFETYESARTTYLHPDDVALQRRAEAEGKKFIASQIREQKIIRAAIIALFAALGTIGFLVGSWFEKK